MALSFEQDIRPLFRQGDIQCMLPFGFNMSKLGDVRMNAPMIYDRLADKSMPTDKPWSDETIAKFKQWMDEGMPE